MTLSFLSKPARSSVHSLLFLSISFSPCRKENDRAALKQTKAAKKAEKAAAKLEKAARKAKNDDATSSSDTEPSTERKERPSKSNDSSTSLESKWASELSELKKAGYLDETLVSVLLCCCNPPFTHFTFQLSRTCANSVVAMVTSSPLYVSLTPLALSS